MLRAADRSYAGHKTAEFAHDADQMMVALSGAFSVINNFGVWTVPAGRAAWIPAGMRHSIQALPRARTRVLYVASRVTRACSVLELRPFMRALVDHVSETPSVRDAAAAKPLLAVLRDQIPQQRELPLFVPAVKSPLARRIAEALGTDLGDTPRIVDLAGAMAVSARTLERAFAADCGMPLGEWRQRTRMCRAITLLAAGGKVQDIALEVGYATPSTFVAAFKKYVGTTPGQVPTLDRR